MQSAQFNFRASYKTRDGKFYFGGINGFSCFYPEELADVKNQFVPPVVITGITFLKGGKKALETKTISTSFYHGSPIEISYKQASFTISYVSLSYVSQADNCYAYMLEGFDTDWHDVCNNRSVYIPIKDLTDNSPRALYPFGRYGLVEDSTAGPTSVS